MTRLQIYLCTTLATLGVAACDSSSGANESERAATPKASAEAPSHARTPAPVEAKSKEAKEAESKAAKEAEIRGWVADVVGEDEEKKKAARAALKELGEEAVPYLSVALIEKCSLAMKSEDKMWGAHDVMKKSLPLMSLLESYTGERGEKALQKILGEKRVQGGWGSSFTRVCASK